MGKLIASYILQANVGSQTVTSFTVPQVPDSGNIEIVANVSPNNSINTTALQYGITSTGRDIGYIIYDSNSSFDRGRVLMTGLTPGSAITLYFKNTGQVYAMSISIYEA